MKNFFFKKQNQKKQRREQSQIHRLTYAMAVEVVLHNLSDPPERSRLFTSINSVCSQKIALIAFFF